MVILTKEMLYKLYNIDKLSLHEIAFRTQNSVHKVSYWMNKWSIKKRDISEAIYAKNHKNTEPFKIKKIVSKKDLKLFYLSMGLFLGEGTKKNKYNVKLANSDPKIIKTFIKFLIDICGVKKSKIKIELNIFDDLDINKVKKWWSNKTKITINNFKYSTIRERKKGTYNNKSTTGTATIYVSNIKLKSIIDKYCVMVLKEFN